jgi:hypothetical protein
MAELAIILATEGSLAANVSIRDVIDEAESIANRVLRLSNPGPQLYQTHVGRACDFFRLRGRAFLAVAGKRAPSVSGGRPIGTAWP